MRDGLKEINELNGVWGSFVADNQGGIILNAAPPSLEADALETISRHVLEVLAASADRIQGLSEAVFHYSDKRLFVVDLEKAILAVICTPSVDISLLRMTVNVVRTQWEDDAKIQQALMDNFLARQ